MLEKALARGKLSHLDRAFITETVYGVLRQRSYLDWILDQKMERPFSRLSARLRNLLRIGAYQILFLSKVPDSAAVNEAVKLSRGIGGSRVAGFVNAVLREVARNPSVSFPEVDADPVGHITTRYSHPSWLVRRWIRRYEADQVMRLCRANNQKAPLTARANPLLTTPGSLKRSLLEEGVRSESCVLSPVGLKISLQGSGRALSDLAAYRRGEFYIQDEGAQLIGFIVDPKPGERILDACAAPGGKASHMAELMGNRGQIIALDTRKDRLDRLKENIARLGHTIIKPVLADTAQAIENLGTRSFDRILVDAPCSGLGLLRRNPEGRWKKTEELIGQYASLQLRILERVAPLLKPGGVLVYSTCTTEPEENEEVADAFIRAHASYKLGIGRPFLPEAAAGLITKEGFFSTIFNSHQMDSFFAAQMTKEG